MSMAALDARNRQFSQQRSFEIGGGIGAIIYGPLHCAHCLVMWKMPVAFPLSKDRSSFPVAGSTSRLMNS